jgi:hypothetical protein
MAKVTGPLMSISATGKLADSIVFFGWKGINVVRQWLKPANPMSWRQGDQRLFMGGVGKAVGKIQPGKAIATQLSTLGLVVAPNTKQSFLVQYILDNYLTDYTSYATELAAVVAHTASLAFGTMADALTIVDFDLAYASVAPFNKKLGLYLIAKALIANHLTGTPYVSNITTWAAADVNGMVNDFTNV